MKKDFSSPFLLFWLMLACGSVGAVPVDLSKIVCELPWEQYTTESNTVGILFEDRGDKPGVFVLPIATSPAPAYTAELKFSMRSLIGGDRTASVGFQILEGAPLFGKRNKLIGHFLVLFDNNGNLDVKKWNGKYYSVVAHRTRFTFTPGKQEIMQVEVSQNGSIKIYMNNKLQLTYRTGGRILEPTPVALVADSGVSFEVSSLEIR
jgi:hypothetical protein